MKMFVLVSTERWAEKIVKGAHVQNPSAKIGPEYVV